jgi:LmbE family N-acetylglucosaminyl deacetylase
MKAAAYFAMVQALPVVPVGKLIADSPFVILSPHPDDETLGTGGLVSLARKQGIEPHVIVVTDGSGSHPRSKLFPRQRLVEVRRAEVEEAGRILGLKRDCLHHLDLPDTQAPRSGNAFHEAAGHIARLVESVKASTMFVTWEGDPHCDHEAASLLAKEVRRRLPELELWAYPIWGWHLDPMSEIDQPPPRGARLDISARQSIKRAAIAAHASQMSDLIPDDPDGFCFTEATLMPFLGPYEYFLEVPR